MVEPEVNYVYAGEVVRVVDGDTLDLRVDRGFDDWTFMRCRIQGCDCPESRGPERVAGEWVTEEVKKWLGDNKVTLQSMSYNRDRYGRALFRIWREGEDLTEWLLQKGYAWHTDKDGALLSPRNIDSLVLPDGIKSAVRSALA